MVPATEVVPVAGGIAQPEWARVPVIVGEGKDLRGTGIGIDGGADGEDRSGPPQIATGCALELHDLVRVPVHGIPIPFGIGKMPNADRARACAWDQAAFQ